MQLQDAHLLVETGWSPEVLDDIPQERLELYLLYRRVRDVVIYGGSFDPETGRVAADVQRSPVEVNVG